MGMGEPFGVQNPLTSNLDVGSFGLISSDDGNIPLTPDGSGVVLVTGSMTVTVTVAAVGGVFTNLGVTNVVGNLNPLLDDTSVVGTISKRWATGYFSGSLNLRANDAPITLGASGQLSMRFDGTDATYALSTGTHKFTGGLVNLGGVTPKGTEILAIAQPSGNASPLVVQESDSSNGMSLNAAGGGYSGFGLGVYWSGAAWTALSTGAALIYKTPTEIVTYANASLTPGGTYSPTIVNRVKLTDGAYGFGPDTPTRSLEVMRTTASGTFAVNGIPCVRVTNKETSGHSFACAEVAGNGENVILRSVVDGLGSGGLVGGVGAVIYVQQNYPLFFGTNNTKRGGFKADGTFVLVADGQKIALGAAEDATLAYDGTNLVIDPQAVGSGLVVINSKKTTTGDPTGAEGTLYWNTVDNVIKMYVAGAWRTLASW